MMNTFIQNYLGNIIPVTFQIESGGEVSKIGEGEPEFTVKLTKELDKKALLTSTSLALGEAYMRGELDVDRDLYEVLDLFMGQMGKFTTDKSALKKIILTARNKKNQKKEVQSHYDIGNDFYKLWLDETMSYSCGYFRSEDDSLRQAQVNKTEHILEKLYLKKGMTLLDIGCGWGFLLKMAAEKYGVKGTGITLSEEQYRQFSREIEEKGLSDRLEVKLMDYRDLENSGMQFDRIVSVGMIEHVGRGNYGLFLKNAARRFSSRAACFCFTISAPCREHRRRCLDQEVYFPGRHDSESPGDHQSPAGLQFLHAGCGEPAAPL